jgi:hypothetical protein
MPSTLHSLLENANVCTVEIGEAFLLLTTAVGVSLKSNSKRTIKSNPIFLIY